MTPYINIVVAQNINFDILFALYFGGKKKKKSTLQFFQRHVEPDLCLLLYPYFMGSKRDN